MALVRNSRFAKGLSGEQIHLNDAGMEVRDFRDVHAERPHRLQWRVNDDLLLRAKWRFLFWHRSNLGNGDDHAPRLRGMLDQFMGVCNLIQGYDLGDVESLPSCLKSLVNIASRLDLCLGWHVVAAHEEQSGVYEDKLPHRSLRHWGIGSVGRNGTTLCQDFRIGLNVSSEGDLYDVVYSIGSQRPDSFSQVSTGQQNLVRPSPRCDLFVALGTAGGDHARSRLVRELNGTSADRTSTALH